MGGSTPVPAEQQLEMRVNPNLHDAMMAFVEFSELQGQYCNLVDEQAQAQNLERSQQCLDIIGSYLTTAWVAEL